MHPSPSSFAVRFPDFFALTDCVIVTLSGKAQLRQHVLPTSKDFRHNLELGRIGVSEHKDSRRCAEHHLSSAVMQSSDYTASLRHRWEGLDLRSNAARTAGLFNGMVNRVSDPAWLSTQIPPRSRHGI